MTEANVPIIITKTDCSRCHELKDWLKENEVNFVERDIDDEEFVHELLQDNNFLATFCDADGCIVNTPAVLHKGKYWFKELWGINGLRIKEAKRLFNVE
ncbi:MAG: glutaredoxin domain-containing protein [Promethearchaeota archaeon]|jgi:glutaredoxin